MSVSVCRRMRSANRAVADLGDFNDIHALYQWQLADAGRASYCSMSCSGTCVVEKGLS